MSPVSPPLDPGGTPAPPRAWDHLRGAFVAWHLVCMAVLALPTPGWVALDPASPIVRDEVAQLGLEGPAADAAIACVFPVVARYVAWHERLTWLPATYAAWTGTEQGWGMYANPDRWTARLIVERREGDVWVPVFARHRDESWHDGVLAQRRVRRYWRRFGTGGSPSAWPVFVGWLEPRLRADFPHATGLRVAIEDLEIPSPADLRAHPVLRSRGRRWELTLDLTEAR